LAAGGRQGAGVPLAARLFLTPIAVVCLIAGLMPLGVAGVAAGKGMRLGLADAALAPSLHLAVMMAAAACVPALILGLAGAISIRNAPPALRFVVIGIAICLLALPAPALTALPWLGGASLRDVARFACAVARGAGLVLLVTAAAVQSITPGLRLAAESAGATPLQAWRHVVLAAVWLPVALGWVGAFLVALAQTQAAMILAPHLDLADAWIAPASLLLVGCSVTAVMVLLRG
jgi:ABC-type Fe3+ transport system permease subunit